MTDLELYMAVVDNLLAELSQADDDDEAFPDLLREDVLEHLRAAPPEAMFAGMTRDDAIFVIEFAQQRGLRTAGEMRARLRKIKEHLVAGGSLDEA